ncbi:MAG: DUF11 domain-containing protein [Chloroflexi bacterium]|nr:MAG: DUF11 domain-containing protein [Chloroflexota bacterium]
MRLKRYVTLSCALLLVPLTCLAPAACGGGGAQITVALTAKDNGPYRAGDTPTFEVVVRNMGPGDAPGVVIRADMPANFRYKSTENISGDGEARTQPIDAHVGSQNPGWGLWDLAAPTLANGEKTYAKLTIDFTVDIEAAPAKYTMNARASDDNTASDLISAPISIEVLAAPRLGLTARVSPSTVVAGDMAKYSITVTNTGTAIASNVDVLVTLPPVAVFLKSVTPFAGNASRSNPSDPARGSVEVFYGGFNVPPASSVGPGFITLTFIAQVVAKPTSGSYPLNVQVTDSLADVVMLHNVASIIVQAATPSPSSASAASPSASPAH